MIMDPWPINKKKNLLIENKIIPLINLAVDKKPCCFYLDPGKLKNFMKKT